MPTAGLSSAERSERMDLMIAQIGALTQQVNVLTQSATRHQLALDGIATFDREQDRRIDAIERGAAVLSAWVRRPFWERVRERMGL